MTTAPGLEAMTLLAFIRKTLTEDPELADLAGSAQALDARVVEGEYRGTGEDGDWAILVTPLDPVDIKGVGMIQVMAQTRAQVKVVGQVDGYLPLVPIYARVHALLEGRTNEDTALGSVLTLQRVSGFQMPERANGIEYRHLGGLYEALTQ